MKLASLEADLGEARAFKSITLQFVFSHSGSPDMTEILPTGTLSVNQ